MKTKFILLIVLTFFFMSCKNNTQNDAQNTIENKEVTNEEPAKLRLDNGQKWIANTETHFGIKKMDSIIKAFKSDTNKNYSVLGESLSEQTSFVIKNCSMKGEPHDQLHVVLVPMLDEISILKESNSIDDSENALQKLELLIQDYFTHFMI